MPRHARTFQLPPEKFWHAPEMREALARRDLAEVVRLVHRKLDWTQLALATVSGYSQGHISKWLAGMPFDPDCLTFKRLEQFAAGFGIPTRLFGIVGPESASPMRGLGADESREEDDVERRKLLIGGPLAIGFGVAGTAVGGMWCGRLGSAHVTQLHRYVDHLIVEDDMHGGDGLFAQAATQFRVVQASLNAGEFDFHAEKKLYGAVGSLAEQTGWLAFDAGLHREARYHYGEALVAARLAGDRELTARTYYAMSEQAVEVGWPCEGLHLAKAGQDVAERLSSPAVLSLLVAQEGAAHARMGAATEALESFARADYLLGRSDGDGKPTWLAFYDGRELDAFKASGLMRLGRYEDAEELYRVAVECDEAYSRNRASRTTNLARSQLAQADVGDAARTAEAALVAVEDGVASTRVIDRLKTLHEQFCDYRSIPAVSSFRDHYQALMGGGRVDGRDLV